MKLYIACVFSFFLSNVSNAIACYDEERAALLSFKSQVSDPSGRLFSWQGRNCCTWHGIRCSSSSHVVVVNLRNPNPDSFIINMNSEIVSTSNSTPAELNGVISPSLFTLTHIKHLDLSFNNFMHSRIPPGLSNLTRLTYLNLSNAKFSDSITTQFSNLTSLKWLDLSCSYAVDDYSTITLNLSTSLTVQAGVSYSYLHGGDLWSANLNWLQGLHNLRKLVMSGVDLSVVCESDRWAHPLSLLTNLRWLQLSNSSVSGIVPMDQLLNLTQLSVLIMDFNSFTSRIPVQMANMSSLSALDLTRSNLQGSIPYIPQLRGLRVGGSNIVVDLESMFAEPWPELETLEIMSTQVVGSIPASFGNTTSLVSFIAYNCSIQSVIPSSMTNLSRLQELELDVNNLRGQLPPSISNMKSLTELSLMQNSLEGSIPVSICNITSLSFIAFAGNELTGELPDCLSYLPNLEVLYVTLNSLTGTIQSLPALFKSSSPYMIGLGYNNLTVKLDQHPFPPNFQPEILDLSVCNIEGRIPDSLSNLTQLVLLQMVGNSLSGVIPGWLFNLPQLGLLDLSFNNLQGFLPPQIRLNSFFGPTNLNLANNLIQGPVPSQFENIDAINLSGNNFTGYIPPQLGFSNARYISLSGNKLFGQIPTSFCHNNSVLMLLDLSNNSLSGTVPTSLGNCTSLSYLNLGQNSLTGGIPEALENAKNLSYIDLTDNHFQGPIPSSFEKLKLLAVLKIGYNNFSGNVPRFIGSLKDLRILVLRSNLFTGTIPEEINKLQKLQVMDLAINKLSGSIPEKLDGLKTLINRPKDGDILGYIISSTYSLVQLNMAYKGLIYKYNVVRTYHSGIDLSLNSLSGNIPSEIILLKGLSSLNLSHNNLSGAIPSNIGEMTGLESLDLSFNNLSEEIPGSINKLDSLSTMNLSYNNLSGSIPSGTRFDTLYGDGSGYIGNKYLCGAPDVILTCRVNSSGVSPETAATVNDDGQQGWFIVVVVTGYGVGVGWFFWFVWLMKKQWKERYWRAIDKIVLKIMECM